jgi:hypothetical protein
MMDTGYVVLVQRASPAPVSLSTFRELLLFSLVPSFPIFRVMLFWRVYTSDYLLLTSPILSSHTKQAPSVILQASSTVHPVEISCPRLASEGPVDATQVNCPFCDQLMLHSTQISVQCYDLQGHHKSRCVTCLLMEMDDCCFEVNTAIPLGVHRTDIYKRSREEL